MKTNHHANGVVAERLIVKGKRIVILDEAEFDRLLIKADEWEPPMPELDANGTYPALEACRVSLARKIIRHRRRVGLTPVDLAQRAGIRLATLNRIERGEVMPSVRTIEKIDRALRKADAKAIRAG
jgi:DNA-binding XRE family transcriptional regulator